MSDSNPIAWIVGGVVTVLFGAVTGWGIYENDRANKEKKERQATEIKLQNTHYSLQETKKTYLKMVNEEIKKRDNLQRMLTKLLNEYKKRNVNCSDEDIDSYQKVFSIIADDGSQVFTTRKDNDYLLNEDTIKKTRDFCSAIQNALNQQHITENDPLFTRRDELKSGIENLELRLNIRLENREKQRAFAEEWQSLVDCYNKDASIQVIPKCQNKGGFICSFGENCTVFMPNSHATESGALNRPIDVLILGVDNDRRQAVVSAREYKKIADFKKFAENNPPGKKVSGKIVHILGEERHAALISFRGYDICGYLPATNMIGHPAQLDKVGFALEQKLDVYVKKTDLNNQRILLSMYPPVKSFRKKSPQKKS